VKQENWFHKRVIFLKTNLLEHAVGKDFRTLTHLEDVVEQMEKINGNITTPSSKCDPSCLQRVLGRGGSREVCTTKYKFSIKQVIRNYNKG